jgi:hypothetical protein
MQLTSTGFVCMLEKTANRKNTLNIYYVLIGRFRSMRMKIVLDSFMPINPYVKKLLHVQTISLNYFLGNESVVTNKN